jgi:integrase
MGSRHGQPYLWLHPRSRRWYVRWRQAGRLYQQSTKETKRAAAERFLREHVKRIDAVAGDAFRMTVHAALDEWLAEKALPRFALGKSTLAEYRVLVRQVKELTSPSLRLFDFGTREVASVLNQLERRHALQPGTMKRKIVTLFSFFRFHQRRRTIDRNPVDGIERPRVRHEPTPEVTRAQYEDLLARAARLRDEAETVGDRNHAEVLLDFMQVLWLSGHRRIELCRLTWEDIDLRARTWWIRSPEKKGGERIEPIHLKLIPILKRRRKVERVGPFRLNVVEKAWKKLKARNPDLPIRTLHAFRAAFATRVALAAGETAAQKLLGHKTLAMTGRYNRSTGLQYREQLEALE